MDFTGSMPTSPSAKKPRIGFAIDIDGVIADINNGGMMPDGSEILPDALPAFARLAESKTPFVLFTNRSFATEQETAAHHSHFLKVPILPEQVVISGSPLRAFPQEKRAEKILLLGTSRDEYVLRDMGLSSIVKIADATGRLFPEISTVCVGNWDTYWAQRDISYLFNLIRSKPTPNDIKFYYFGRSDSRGQLQANLIPEWRSRAYPNRLESPGEHISLGKPNFRSFACAEKLLLNWNEKLCAEEGEDFQDLDMIYMIGDTPEADISGTISYLEQGSPKVPWGSILLETGNYKPGQELLCKPSKIIRGITEAVAWGLANDEERMEFP